MSISQRSLTIKGKIREDIGGGAVPNNPKVQFECRPSKGLISHPSDPSSSSSTLHKNEYKENSELEKDFISAVPQFPEDTNVQLGRPLQNAG